MNAADYASRFKSSIDTFNKKGESKQEMMTEYAESLRPDSESMFPRHRAMYKEMADQLAKNLNYYTATPQTQAEFQQNLSELLNFKAQAEGFYSVNFGKPSDKAGAATWMGQSKAMMGGNPYKEAGYQDERSYDDYVGEFEFYQTPSFDNKISINRSDFSIGGGSMNDFIQEEFSRVPFQPTLIELPVPEKAQPVEEATQEAQPELAVELDAALMGDMP